MGLEGLKAVLAQYEANPEKANGFSSGGYSLDYDKIWRGNTVIAYVNPQDNANGANPDVPKFLPTSRTTPEEGNALVTSQAIAPPEPVSAPMTISSPEGAASEEKPPEEIPSTSGGVPPEEIPSDAEAYPEEEGGEGAASNLGELDLGKEPPPPSNPEHFANRRKETDPLGLAAETRPTRENLETLANSRLEETRRKYFSATAYLQFDVEAKGVTGGERICLYLLPVIRSEGKYELYDFTVTQNSSIPSQYAVQQAVFAATAEAIPHVTVNRSALVHVARRVHSAMKAAKDLAGGFNGEESVTESIDRYLAETE